MQVNNYETQLEKKFTMSLSSLFRYFNIIYKYFPGNNSNLFLGSTVVDVTTKTIFLFYTIKQNGRNQNNYIRSTDDGMTWSQPVDISDQIGSEKFRYENTLFEQSNAARTFCFQNMIMKTENGAEFCPFVVSSLVLCSV